MDRSRSRQSAPLADENVNDLNKKPQTVSHPLPPLLHRGAQIPPPLTDTLLHRFPLPLPPPRRPRVHPHRHSMIRHHRLRDLHHCLRPRPRIQRCLSLSRAPRNKPFREFPFDALHQLLLLHSHLLLPPRRPMPHCFNVSMNFATVVDRCCYK
jgi:hypothetical protein